VFKFIHAADLHLDSPLRGLERYEGAPVDAIRQATRKALQNLVALAIDEKVDFVLIAGDVYDGDWQDYNTGLFFVKEMKRLKDAGIHVVLIAGNHDAANKMTKTLDLPDNVKRMRTDKPETKPFEDIGVAVHGQGFRTAAVTDNLSQNYPKPVPGYFNIGLLHTSLTGSEGEKDHETYAPCSLKDLQAKGYDYWALGHLHKEQTRQLSDPMIAYSGTTQGRKIKSTETGAKGCLLVRVNDNHQIEAREFCAVDVFRWEVCNVDASDLESPEGVLDRFDVRLDKLVDAAENRPLSVRVEVCGASDAHSKLAADPDHWTNEIRSRALIRGSDQVWVEKVKFQTRPAADTEAFYSSDGAIGELVALVRDARGDEAQLRELSTVLDDLRSKIPAELLNSENLKLDDKWIAEVLQIVEPMLATLLMGSDAE